MMDVTTRTYYENLASDDGTVRYEAYNAILAATEQPVDWAYEVWDELVARLQHKNNHQRSIAAQLLCNLAQSDPEGRIFDDFAALLTVTKDEKFVTARHSLQSLWRIGLAGDKQRRMVADAHVTRFAECSDEKNGTLTRSDSIQGLKHLYNATGDEAIQEMALALIATEEDEKYRKKYAAVWKKR